jgi:subtilisin family serine protease
LPIVDRVAFQEALVAAANRGARVINISLANPDTSLTALPAPATYDSTLRYLIRTLVENERDFASGRAPLYVISTGNAPGRDAYYSWFPVLVDSLPDRVINVVGSDRTRNLPWTPGTSSRIHVAAPGDSVGTWGATGGIYQTGTSFATPLVAGVAGLLFSFDPRLTAAEVKDLIIRGARAGGDSAQGVPILDAYESLRLAAERPGAPLCGNRLWAVGDSVYASRGSTTERIVVVPTGVNRVIPFHGGRLLGIQSFNASSSPLFEWQNGANTVTNRSPQSWESVTGTSQSIFASRSHDGDTTLTVASGSSALVVNQSPGGTLASVPLPAGSSTTVMKCMRRSWDFGQDIYVCHVMLQSIPTVWPAC